jgi:[ribosomal protein S18]-alanine N-acetyltransferase
MPYVVEELTDPTPARPNLDRLARLNSELIDLDAEAQLPHARFWVVYNDLIARPVAYALVWLLGDEVEIVDLATLPEWRRKGAASELLRALELRYQLAGVGALYLEVRADNLAAIALYTQLGWQQTRVRRRYYADGQDAYDMRKALA